MQPGEGGAVEGLGEGFLVGPDGAARVFVAVEEGDELELFAAGGAERVAHDLDGGQGATAEDLDERQVDVAGGGAVDDLGADELVGAEEIEVEVVGFAGVVEGAGDDLATRGVVDARAEDGHAVGLADGVFGGGENNALARGLDDGVRVAELVGRGEGGEFFRDARIVGESEGAELVGGADVERGVGPVAGQEGVGEIPVAALDEDVAGPELAAQLVELVVADERVALARGAEAGVAHQRGDEGTGAVEAAAGEVSEFVGAGGEFLRKPAGLGGGEAGEGGVEGGAEIGGRGLGGGPRGGGEGAVEEAAVFAVAEDGE